jgi:hypothetical protein
MKLPHSVLSTLTVCLLAIGSVAPAAAQTYTELGASAATGAGYLSSFGYDDKHQVYLHVFEKNVAGKLSVVGRFIGANGAILGQEFVVSTNMLTFGSRPRVAYSRGSSADAFFVEYTADQNCVDCAGIYGAVVRYTGTGVSGGVVAVAGIPLSPGSLTATKAIYQATGDVAFNPATSQFMAAWEEHAGATNVSVRLFNADGSAAGSAIPVTSGGGGKGAPVLAYDWQRNRFCVQFLGDNPLGGGVGMFAYLLDGSSGAISSSLVVLSTSPAVLEPAIAYLPEANGFLTAWTLLIPGSRVSMARFIPSTATSGALPNAEYVAMSSNQAVGLPSMDYDYVSRRVLMASMRSLDPNPGVIAGAIFSATGTPLTATFNLSTQVIAGERLGTFNPTVRAAGSGIVGMSYTIDYAAAQFERFQLPAAQAPGPSFDCGNNCTPPPPPPPPPPPTDTDGDGVPDSQDACPSVFAQTANGCPIVPATVNGDFNADGKPELVYQNAGAPGQVYSWFLNSNLTFSSGAYLVNENVPAGWSVVGTSDFTGDGKPDVLYQNQTTGQLVLFVMSGTTKIGEQVLGASPAWRVVATGDFNGDGKTDLVWQNVAAGQIYFWFMTSSGGVASTTNPFQGAYMMDTGMNVITIADKNWRVVGVADLNGDHKLDLIWQHSTGNLAAYYLNGTVATGAIDVSLNDPTWKVRAVGDYNLDGHPDLIFQNVVNGQIAAWLLTGANGATLLGSANVGTVSLIWTLSGPK